MQKSIMRSAQCSGVSITGQHESIVRFEPAEPDTGIVFIREDLPGQPEVPCLPKYCQVNSRWTLLDKSGIRVEHTEHLLAALAGLGIDNIRIFLNSSHIPVVSNFSSGDFVKALLQARPMKQKAARKYLQIREPHWVFDSFHFGDQRYDSILLALPSPHFVATYLLDYPSRQLPTQIAHYDRITPMDFISQIATARSFIMDFEYEQVHKLIGKTMQDCLVISTGTEQLMGENEPARHKLLDMIGDLYTLGTPVKGQFVGIRTGHKTNILMAKKLHDIYSGDTP